MDSAATPPPNSGDDERTEFISRQMGAAVFADVLRPRGLPAEALGDFIGLYRLVEKLGDGGFGSVWRAEQTEPVRREVALKIIKLGMDTLEVMARFELERQALALMDHPNIARVLDAGATPEGRPFFVMELVRGVSITTYCQANNLSLRQRLALFKDVCSGVQHAHQKGVIHRDLKPSNILVTQHDGLPVPKIIDFGIAKAVTQDRLTEFTLVTRAEQLIGTPLYMSPEQVITGRDIDTRCDVYSLGVLLYELLTGQPPFDAQTLLAAGYDEMCRIIREVEPLRPSQRVTTTANATASLFRRSRPLAATALRGDLDWIVMKSVEKERELRYESPTALSDDLQRYLSDQPVMARPPTLSYVTRRWIRRHKVAAFATLICTLAIVMGTSLAVWQALRATAAQKTAETNAYYATVANALGQRGRSDFASARRMLNTIPPAQRGFEWRLVKGLCEGDDQWSVTPGGGAPESLAWDPVTKRIVVLMANRRLCFIDPKTGRHEDGITVAKADAKWHEKEFGRGLHNLAISPDGRHFACADGDAVIVGELASGKVIHMGKAELAQMQWLDADRLIYGAFSMAYMDANQDSSFVFRVSTGETKSIRNRVSGPFAISPDGKRVAWVLKNTLVVVRRITDDLFASEQELLVRPQREGRVEYLAFDGDGSHIAVAWKIIDSSDVGVYQVPSGKQVFNQAQPVVFAMAMSPDEPLLVDSETQPWLRTWRYLKSIPNDPTYDDGGLSSKDPYHLGGPYSPPLSLNSRSAQEGRAGFMFGHEATVTGICVPSGENAIITSSRDGTVRRWPLKSLIPDRYRMTGVETRYQWHHPTASPNGAELFFLQTDEQACLWNRQTGKRMTFPKGHLPLAALGEGRAMTRHEATRELVMWESLGGVPIETWRIEAPPSYNARFSQVVHAALSRDGRRIAAQLAGRLFVVDLDKRTAWGTGDQRMSYGPIGVQGMDLSPDGRTIAVTGFVGRRVRLYSADDLTKPFVTLNAEDAPPSHDVTAVFSRDGTRLYVGNHDGKVRVFDPITGRERPGERWQAHTSVVSAMTVSKDGAMVATASDGSIILWDAVPDASGFRRERLRLPARAARNWICFAGEDTALMHSAPWEPIEVWQASEK